MSGKIKLKKLMGIVIIDPLSDDDYKDT